MMTIVKGFSPAEAVKVFHLAKAQPFLRYREQPPGAPYATANADTNGTVAVDLPTRTEFAIVRANGTAIVVHNATTVVTSS